MKQFDIIKVRCPILNETNTKRNFRREKIIKYVGPVEALVRIEDEKPTAVICPEYNLKSFQEKLNKQQCEKINGYCIYLQGWQEP